MPSANKTANLGLNQWLGNEYPKRTDFVEDNKKIDDAFGELDSTIKNIDLSSTKVIRPNKKTVEESLSANETSILEVEKIANSAKQRGDEVKQSLVDKLISEGSQSSTSESFEQLIGKIELERHKSFPKWFKTNDLFVSGANMLTPRSSFYSSSVGNDIYCICGSVKSGKTSVNECYNTITNTWTTKLQGPRLRTSGAADAVGNVIYLIGGDVLNTEAYDTLSNAWTSKASIPAKRDSLAVVASGTNIYCMGGADGGPSNSNQVYSTISNTWTNKKVMPTSRSRFSASVVNGKIYCIGGLGGSSTSILTNNDCYDTISDSWETKSPMPTKRYGLGSCVVSNFIYCIGGNGSNVNERYDISNDKWESRTSLSTSRDSLSVLSVNGIAYCMGGYFGEILEINDVYIP